MIRPVSDPTAIQRRPAVFFDRDNTLIVADDYLGDPEKVVLVDGAAACVAGARELGFAVVVVSNQSGVARGYYTEADVRAVDARLDGLLWSADRGAKVDHHDFCPHHPTHGVAPYRADCDCRKPRDGMLRRSADLLGIDLSQSWSVGDAPRDVAAGRSAGCRTILLSVPGLAPSPAASADSTAEPDFRAASLAEVLDILRRQTRPEEAALSAGASNDADPTSQASDEADPTSRSSGEETSTSKQSDGMNPTIRSSHEAVQTFQLSTEADPTAPHSDEADPPASYLDEADPTAQRSREADPTAQLSDEADPAAQHSDEADPTAQHSDEADPTAQAPGDSDPTPNLSVEAASAAGSEASTHASDEAVDDPRAVAANDAEAFDAAFYAGRPREAQPNDPEPARPKVVIGSKSAAATSPLAKKAAAAGVGGKTPEELRQSVDDRARRLRERFGAIRSQSAPPHPDEAEAPPRPAAAEVNVVKVATEAASTAAAAAARSATDAAVDKLRRERDAHADDFSLLRLFAGVAQMLALGTLVWSLAADLNQARLLLAVFLQLLALTLVMGSRSGV